MTTDGITTPKRSTDPAIITPAPDDPPAQRPRSLWEGTDDDYLDYILNITSLEELKKALATKNKVGTALRQKFDGEAAGHHPQDLVEATAASLSLPPTVDLQDSVDHVQREIANAAPPSLTIEQRRAALQERQNATTSDRHADVRELFKAMAARDDPQAMVGALSAVQDIVSAELIDHLKSKDKSKAETAANVIREVTNGYCEVRRSLILGHTVQGIIEPGVDPEVLRERTADLCSILSIKPDPEVAKVSPKVRKVVEYIQHLAVVAVATILKVAPKNAFRIAREGATRHLLGLLDSTSEEVVDTAAIGLDCIAGYYPRYFIAQIVPNQAMLSSLLKLALLPHKDSKHTVRLVRIAASALSCFCAGKARDCNRLVRPALPALAWLHIAHHDEGIVTAACRCLARFAARLDATTQEVVDVETCPRFFVLLRDTTRPVAVHAAAGHAAASILAGTHAQVDQDPPPFLKKLLESKDSAVQEMACCAIETALSWGGKEQVQEVTGFVPSLFELLQEVTGFVPSLFELLASSEFSTRMAALRAILAFTLEATPDQIHAVIDTGCLPSLTKVLTWDVAEREGVQLALLTFRQILYDGVWFFRPGDDGSLARNYRKGLRIITATAGLRIQLLDQDWHRRWYPDEGIRHLGRGVIIRNVLFETLYFALKKEGAGWRSSKNGDDM